MVAPVAYEYSYSVTRVRLSAIALCHIHYAYNYKGVPIRASPRLREVPYMYTAHCPELVLERPTNTLRHL